MSKRNRRFLFVRHAQRLDRYVKEAYPSVKDWTEQCFTKAEYRPMNIEFPLTLPHRNPADLYLDDSPITTLGESCAQLVGNRLAEVGMRIDMAYSSPSLRCVQTCHRILQGYSYLNGPHNIKIKLEGGLYEFGSFSGVVPKFLEPKFFADRGIPVDLTYKNNVTEEDLLNCAWESYKDFRARGQKCLERILNTAGPEVNTIMIVTHAPTLITFVRELLKKPISEDNLQYFSETCNLFNKPSYVASVMVEQNQEKQWILPLPQPLGSFEIRAITTFSQNWLDKQKYDCPLVP